MNSRQIATALVAGLLISSLGVVGAVGTVSAQTTQEECDAVFSDCDEGWLSISNVTATVDGFVDRVSASFGDESEVTSTQSADQVQTFFNSNSSSFVQAYNNRAADGLFTDTVIIRMTFEDESEDTTSKFLYAQFDSQGVLQSAQIQDNVNDGDVADEYVRITGYAQEEAPNELEQFHKEFIETGDAVPQSYVSKKLGQYGSDIEGSFDLQGEEQ